MMLLVVVRQWIKYWFSVECLHENTRHNHDATSPTEYDYSRCGHYLRIHHRSLPQPDTGPGWPRCSPPGKVFPQSTQKQKERISIREKEEAQQWSSRSISAPAASFVRFGIPLNCHVSCLSSCIMDIQCLHYWNGYRMDWCHMQSDIGIHWVFCATTHQWNVTTAARS